ncbi:hypothetical protein E4U41_007744, partial [Claviceps citrina]
MSCDRPASQDPDRSSHRMRDRVRRTSSSRPYVDVDGKATLVTERAVDNGFASPPEEPDEAAAPLSTKKALWAWLILCFSTGPTSGMVNNYVTASIQSAANAVGHIPGTDKPCARRGAIKCVVKLGGRDVDYLSYL